METIIGRDVEKNILSTLLKSGEPELLAVYGRRRVGKTFLIRNFFENQLAFEISGIHHASIHQQLENFSTALSKKTGFGLAKPRGWMEAFGMLIQHLTPLVKRKRKVIFFDEFPWLSSPRSGFMQAFENFWNTWASVQKNLVVVICGSAASWMIEKVVNNRGGLHNRVTRKIRLLPFTIGEMELFLKARKINLDRYQLLQLYMGMGGIPQYLKAIEKGESAVQAIDKICFSKDGLLQKEFKELFYSLFDDANYHLAIIRALSKKGKGLSRNEIIEVCKLSSGGGITQLLEELIESGFITAYIPFGKNAKDIIYKLTDEYCLFYLKFIENCRSTGPGTWIKLSTGNSWKSWSGLAFENIGIKHILQIKKTLGIEGVYTETSIWQTKTLGEERGAQIDLVIDRQDQCIHICELKFSIHPFEITKKYADELREKLSIFQQATQTKKTLFLTMLTTNGIKNRDSYTGLLQHEITMDAFFKA